MPLFFTLYKKMPLYKNDMAVQKKKRTKQLDTVKIKDLLGVKETFEVSLIALCK